MTNKIDEKTIRISDLESETLPDDALAGLTLPEKQRVFAAHRGYKMARAEQKQRKAVLSLAMGKSDRYIQIDEIVDMGSKDNDLLNVVFQTTEKHYGTYWRAVHNGVLCRSYQPTKADAILVWLELEANDGREDGAARYAARVLGLPEND